MHRAINKNYPCQYERHFVLKNGIRLFIRPVLSTDGDLLVDLFNRMSARSIYLRFLRRLDALPEDLIRRFTQVDYHGEFALVAMVQKEGEEIIVGVARYGQNPHEDATDLAVAVCDGWQHFGLGKILLLKIIEIAGENGILRFTGMMDAQNSVIRHMLSELGYKVTYVFRNGFFQVSIA